MTRIIIIIIIIILFLKKKIIFFYLSFFFFLGVSSSTIPLCEAVPLLPPSGGTCVVVDDCSVPFTEIAVECRFIYIFEFIYLFIIIIIIIIFVLLCCFFSGWSVPCGEFELSFTPTKLSEGTNRLVPINARPASNSFISMFFYLIIFIFFFFFFFIHLFIYFYLF